MATWRAVLKKSLICLLTMAEVTQRRITFVVIGMLLVTIAVLFWPKHPPPFDRRELTSPKPHPPKICPPVPYTETPTCGRHIFIDGGANNGNRCAFLLRTPSSSKVAPCSLPELGFMIEYWTKRILIVWPRREKKNWKTVLAVKQTYVTFQQLWTLSKPKKQRESMENSRWC